MRTAILGASGLVGRTMLALLEDEDWVQEPPRLLTSDRSAGTLLAFRGEQLVCRDVARTGFDGIGVALFSAGRGISRDQAPRAAAAGAFVVDNSSAWRLDPDVPLVVPEINASALTGGRIIANPNCSTIQIAMALAPLDRAYGLREAHVTTLQAVSGAGQQGLDELGQQAQALAHGERSGAAGAGDLFPRRIAANAIPAIGALGDGGFFDEELKVHAELRKILGRGADLAVTCTATRVPVWNGHSAAIRAVLARETDLDEARRQLAAFPGLEVAAGAGGYLTPAEVSGRTTVHVGRLRHEPGRRDVLLLWVVADNLLKGAAWNAVQIARRLAGADTP